MTAPAPTAFGYDVATALWQGARPYQEDTLLADFHGGMDRGFAILADGMGGHAAGDLASRLVVIDAASHLKFLMHDGPALEAAVQAELTSAINGANDLLKERAAQDSRLAGMGSTFLATVVFGDRLYWASVGDSPLYLWRGGRLRQLNADHSMAPVIDQMAKSGEITEAAAATHPDRNALTSVLMGGALKAMDVPKTALVLEVGDVVIQASDGVQSLDINALSGIVSRGGSSREIADAVMEALHGLNNPTQDNASLLVLQRGQARARGVAVTGAAPAPTPAPAPEPARAPALEPTPASVPSRGAGGRRWIVPAALGGAAAVAGLLWGVPALRSVNDPAPVRVPVPVTVSPADLTADAPAPADLSPPAPEALAPPAPEALAPPVPALLPAAPVPANPLPSAPSAASLAPALAPGVAPIDDGIGPAQASDIEAQTTPPPGRAPGLPGKGVQAPSAAAVPPVTGPQSEQSLPQSPSTNTDAPRPRP